ncbi:DUF2937 family protein [Pontibacter sp. JAM-7]|uniref:DUF2937 family protein n=1 Tax=Pontibacter sp. JAM-7 TaxID=3366581 RepID=UPI003AF683C3
MRKVFEYLKLIVFVAGVLAGVQVPGFVDQYGKHLNSRLAESSRSVAAFQQDADTYFGGDIAQLIVHYKNTADPAIVSGANHIDELFSRNQVLLNAQETFNRSLLSAYTQVLFTPVPEVRVDTWQQYAFVVLLDRSALVVGVLAGVLVLLGLELSVVLLNRAIRRSNRSRHRTSDLHVDS